MLLIYFEKNYRRKIKGNEFLKGQQKITFFSNFSIVKFRFDSAFVKCQALPEITSAFLFVSCGFANLYGDLKRVNLITKVIQKHVNYKD